jgi:hypothetical protein
VGEWRARMRSVQHCPRRQRSLLTSGLNAADIEYDNAGEGVQEKLRGSGGTLLT